MGVIKRYMELISRQNCAPRCPPPFGTDGDLAHECLEGGSSPIVKDLKFIEGMI